MTIAAEPVEDGFAVVTLTPDLSTLSADERAMLAPLTEAAGIMDELFWIETVGSPSADVLGTIADPVVRRRAELHMGPWDRLRGGESLVPGVGDRRAGAAFYPADMTAQEFEAEAGVDGTDLRGPFALVRRDGAGRLTAIPYHDAF